jgi:hypothetical protein
MASLTIMSNRRRAVEPKELFGVVVRTVGLMISISGLWYLGYAVAQATGLSEETYPTGDYVISGAPFTALGVFLLLGAPFVVRIAYRKN